MKTRRLLTLLLCVTMTLSIFGCSSNNMEEYSDNEKTDIEESIVEEEETLTPEPTNTPTATPSPTPSPSPTPTPTPKVLNQSLEEVVETLTQAISENDLEFSGVDIDYNDYSTIPLLSVNYDLGYLGDVTLMTSQYAIKVYELDTDSQAYNEYYQDNTLPIYAVTQAGNADLAYTEDFVTVNGQYVLMLMWFENGNPGIQVFWPDCSELEPIYNAFVSMN